LTRIASNPDRKRRIVVWSAASGTNGRTILWPIGGSQPLAVVDRKSTRLNSSHVSISYAVFCLKKKIISSRNDNYKTVQKKTNEAHKANMNISVILLSDLGVCTAQVR